MTSPRDAKAAIHELISAVVGVPVIWGFPNTPPPPRPYVVLTMVPGVAAVGHDEDQYNAGDELMVSVGIREATIDVQVIQKPLTAADIDAGNDTAVVLAQNWRDQLIRADIREQAQNLGIAVQRLGDVVDVSTLLGEDFEDRASFEVRFGYCTITPATPVPRIDTVEVQPNYDGVPDDLITIP